MENNKWVHAKTLGGKSTTFKWKIDNNSTVTIDKDSGTEIFDKLVVDKILKFVKSRSGWVKLDNNLVPAEREEGLGAFMYTIKPNNTYQQYSSQLGPILYEAEIWNYNGLKRGIAFKDAGKIMNWENILKEYYDASKK